MIRSAADRAAQGVALLEMVRDVKSAMGRGTEETMKGPGELCVSQMRDYIWLFYVQC